MTKKQNIRVGASHSDWADATGQSPLPEPFVGAIRKAWAEEIGVAKGSTVMTQFQANDLIKLSEESCRILEGQIVSIDPINRNYDPPAEPERSIHDPHGFGEKPSRKRNRVRKKLQSIWR